MKFVCKNTSFIVGLIFSVTLLDAQNIKPSFDVNEIIEQVSQHRYLIDSRYGEFLIDTNAVYMAATRDQTDAAVTFDGTNFFVVWRDNRYTANGYNDIYGTRVNQSGVILDPMGIAISSAYDSQCYPAVASDGTNYFVVWHDERNTGTYRDIYGARVSRVGVVLDTAGIPICTDYEDQGWPAVAFDGENYLVVWQDSRLSFSHPDIYGARVNKLGEVLDTAGIPICTADDEQLRPSVTFGDYYYFVVWSDKRSYRNDIYGSRVTQTGIVLDRTGILISGAYGYQYNPSVAFDGTNYFVVWEDEFDDPNWPEIDVYGSRVTQTGTVLDPAGILISGADGYQFNPSVAFDGTNYLVTWHDTRNGYYDIYSSRVKQSGEVVDPDGIPISVILNNQETPAIAFGGTNYIVIWQDHRSVVSYDIYGTQVDQSGSVVDSIGFLVSSEVNSQENPSIAFDGTNYLVVWTDFRNYPASLRDIYGMRVASTGEQLDTSAIAISKTNDKQDCPSIAFGDSNYFVVWHDKRWGDDYDIYGTRITQSGVVLDTLGIPISTAADGQFWPSITFDGTNYFVVWSDERDIEYHPNIYGTRVTQSGIVLDTSGIPISTVDGDLLWPSVIFDSTNYFVVWIDPRNSPLLPDVYGARVSPSGAVIDSLGIRISDIHSKAWWPTIAFDGTNFLVVWYDGRNIHNSRYDIYGKFVNKEGTVYDTVDIPISTAAGDQYYPDITFDGADFIVAWQDRRSMSSWDIYGAKVDTLGTIINRFPISLQERDQISPALGSGASDSILITYSGWTSSINTQSVNTMRVWGKFYPFVGIEENLELKAPVTKFGLNVYPNPVHNKCNIKYTLQQKTLVCISLYDVTGRLMKKLVNEPQEAGIYNEIFDLIDLSQGVYFVRLKTVDNLSTKKIVLTR